MIQTLRISIAKIFLSPHFIALYAVGILTTYVLVITGIDWRYLNFVVTNIPPEVLFFFDVIGYIVPTVIISFLWIQSRRKKSVLYHLYASAVLHAITIALFVSALLKAITNRTPPIYHFSDHNLFLIDNSNSFDFGFMRESIINGWPSSHAAVIFAIAFTFFFLLPRNYFVKTVLFTFAISISIGLSFGSHWLSETIMGILVGSIVGKVVGTQFLLYKKDT